MRGISLPTAQLFVIAIENVLRGCVGNLTRTTPPSPRLSRTGEGKGDGTHGGLREADNSCLLDGHTTTPCCPPQRLAREGLGTPARPCALVEMLGTTEKDDVDALYAVVHFHD